MTIGTFGTLTEAKKSKKPLKIKKYKTSFSGKYKCSGCSVANDDEDAVIEHIMAQNECKAQFYRIGKDEDMPVLS